MVEDLHKRVCPICSNDNHDVIERIAFRLYDGHPMNGGYNLVQCSECGFVFANTQITQPELDSYYENLSKYEDKIISTGGGYSKEDKLRLEGTANFLESHIPNKHSRILDLGCANGGLLKELKNLGFDNIVGIDPSSACVTITKAEVGCECYQHSIFDIPREIGRFDFVICSHVLEHLLDVGKSIQVISSLLNLDGKIYLECPNADQYKDVIHAPFQEFNAEHINHFNPNSLSNLMLQYGFVADLIADKVFKITSGQNYHAVFGIFCRADFENNTIKFDQHIRKNIAEYIAKSVLIMDRIEARLNALPDDMPVAFWGIGQFAFKLLANPLIAKRRNIRLFDRGSAGKNKFINGSPILSGDEILQAYSNEKFAIIITSLIHEFSIREGIKNVFNNGGIPQPTVIGFSDML